MYRLAQTHRQIARELPTTDLRVGARGALRAGAGSLRDRAELSVTGERRHLSLDPGAALKCYGLAAVTAPEHLTLAPTSDPKVFLAPDGTRRVAPEGWACLPPGDAGLTRRVKQAGPSWSIIERRGRKAFSKGLWAPRENIEAERRTLEAERSTPAYAAKRARATEKRQQEQAGYVVSFEVEVLGFLRFAPRYEALARAIARRVTEHATPVGSGTVARTERIPIERRAEAAVIAWLRHQTTAYDRMSIARQKGARREVRRELATISRAILDLHRRDAAHAAAACPLCTALPNELVSPR